MNPPEAAPQVGQFLRHDSADGALLGEAEPRRLDDLGDALGRISPANVAAILIRGQGLPTKGPVVRRRRREKQLSTGPQQTCEAFDELLILVEMLDHLEADDLVERAQVVTEMVNLAKVADAELRPIKTGDLRPVLGSGQLAIRKGKAQGLVARARGHKREPAVTGTRVKRTRWTATQVPADEHPPVHYARIAVKHHPAPAEHTHQKVTHAKETSASARPSHMRVHIVMPLADERGGAERLLGYLLSGDASDSVTWAVTFLEDGPMVDAARAAGVDVEVAVAGRVRDAARYARTVRTLARRLRKTKADAVFSWMGRAHFYAGPAGVIARVPAVWYQHGRAVPGAKADIALQRLPARGIIATSASVAEAQAAMRPMRPTRVVHPAVQPELLALAGPPDATRARRELGLTDYAPVIGTVGRLQRWKGHQHMIEALPDLRRTWPGIAYVVVGGDHPSEPEYGPRSSAARESSG